MQDDHGGLQRFLFDWLHWPRLEVSTFKGVKSEVYLENLLPTFYIDQNEGWTDLQALQIGRYGQQQISEIVIEYQLGALEAVRVRVARQQARQRELALRDRARTISDQVGTVFRKHGWRVDWSSNGAIENVVARWSPRTLRETLKQEANVDLPAHCALLNKRIDQLRDSLTKQPLDLSDSSAPVATSQAVIELKEERHRLNEELHALRMQGELAEELVGSFHHRIQAASDLLRLKRTGIGRLDRMECPSCHRDIDPETFGLTDQSEESVSAHIDALKRDQQLMGKNYRSLQSSLEATHARLQEVVSLLRDAERLVGDRNGGRGNGAGAVGKKGCGSRGCGKGVRSCYRNCRRDREVAEFDRRMDIGHREVAGDERRSDRLRVAPERIRPHPSQLRHGPWAQCCQCRKLNVFVLG